MLGPRPPKTAGKLRLRAEDADDLAVIAACLQDALVTVRDLAYDREARCFMLVANRFRWERCGLGGTPQDGGAFERILCGIAFDEADSVVYRGFHRSEEDRILALLTIRPTSVPGEGANGAIDLEFSGGATIRLSVSAISCWVRDLGEPWPTARYPDHPMDEPG